MEIHHHPHSARKKWKHYFWEFLMLFLAVFCGFLAEYQLEHKIEKEREKQYMESLIEDLRLDTATYNSEMELGKSQVLITDSLLELINNHEITDDNIKEVYRLSANSTRIVNAESETRTADQLKNAGGMRLIRKKLVADSILGYWKNIAVLKGISERLDEVGSYRSTVSAQLFHNKYFVLDTSVSVFATGVSENPRLIRNDPALIAEYSNRTFSRKRILNNYILYMGWTKSRAVRLIKLIRNQYHIREN